ncbi:hypothetical protein K470DRAFT_256823 [Piedraia hortae CBS 480.64]|uniref:Secreted protein n=1 Tax=Piedraia hortae CBS 480.64 TaxID=1314780 RepID=A0A6A7C240_9PEZI|nr:hypothetical protein K470DRAFT_256823 [Piedraia hortae CBS 480.64]
MLIVAVFFAIHIVQPHLTGIFKSYTDGEGRSGSRLRRGAATCPAMKSSMSSIRGTPSVGAPQKDCHAYEFPRRWR